jgi:hypothetical protein
MTYVLRKTVEGFSAGTRVEFEPHDADPTQHEKITCYCQVDPNYIFEVNLSDLTKLRSRIQNVPANAGERKRKRKQARRERVGNN